MSIIFINKGMLGEFRQLVKSDLEEIVSVAKKSYSKASFESYVLVDILACFDNNQRYLIKLYGFFKDGKLVHFSGFAKVLGIGNCYELRLTSTLPEARRMGYTRASLERSIQIIKELVGDEKALIQLATQIPHFYEPYGFIMTSYKTKNDFTYLYKILN